MTNSVADAGTNLILPIKDIYLIKNGSQAAWAEAVAKQKATNEHQQAATAKADAETEDLATQKAVDAAEEETVATQKAINEHQQAAVAKADAQAEDLSTQKATDEHQHAAEAKTEAEA